MFSHRASRGCTPWRGRTLRTRSLYCFFFHPKNLTTTGREPPAGRCFAAPSRGVTAQRFRGTGGSPAVTAGPALLPTPNPLLLKIPLFPTVFGCCSGRRHRAVTASRSTPREDEPAHAAARADRGEQGIMGNVCKFPCRTAARRPVSALPSPGTPGAGAGWHRRCRWSWTGAGPAGTGERQPLPRLIPSFMEDILSFPSF